MRTRSPGGRFGRALEDLYVNKPDRSTTSSLGVGMARKMLRILVENGREAQMQRLKYTLGSMVAARRKRATACGAISTSSEIRAVGPRRLEIKGDSRCAVQVEVRSGPDERSARGPDHGRELGRNADEVDRGPSRQFKVPTSRYKNPTGHPRTGRGRRTLLRLAIVWPDDI